MSEERVFLTPEDAEAMLPDGDLVHTFRGGGSIIIGADWDRNDLIKSFKKYRPELSGEQATAMNHGIVLTDDRGYLFVETRKP
jgi:hypothetical protein